MAKKPSKLDQALAAENPPLAAATEIVAFTPDNPLVVFQSQEKFDELLGKIRATVKAHVPDVTTKKGRDEIKSLAFRVVKTRTTLDAAGKSLNESKRDEINAVDAQRREIRTQLEALEAEARGPLDEWEAKEAERQNTISTVMELLRIAGTHESFVFAGDASLVQSAIAALDEMTFDADVFQDALEAAIEARIAARERLTTLHATKVQAEADALELARLRQEKAERDAKEEAERAERERIEREEQERKDAEAAAKAAEQAAETARQQAEAQRLADIKAAEDRAADEARQAAAREAQAKIDAANAEAARLKKIEDDRIAEEKRLAEEQAARDADRAHRGKVMKAAKEAIMALGINEADAKAVVLAIVAGEIPAVKLTF